MKIIKIFMKMIKNKNSIEYWGLIVIAHGQSSQTFIKDRKIVPNSRATALYCFREGIACTDEIWPTQSDYFIFNSYFLGRVI